MRRSRRADADTPRGTPGNVEAVRAAANAASSEGSGSDVHGNSFRVASSPRHRVFSHDTLNDTRKYHFPLDHAQEDTHEDSMPSRFPTGRVRMDEDVGSVSTVCSDMESDFVDVALEACSFGSFALGAQDTPTRSKAKAKARAFESRLEGRLVSRLK